VIDFVNASLGTSFATYAQAENRATMHTMARLRKVLTSQSLVAFCLALSLSQGCARSERLHPDASSPASDKDLPFGPDTEQAFASALPFPALSHPRVLPSGTLLTVQLEGSLSTAKVQAGDAFAASVAAPVTIDSDTFIERGTAVTGRIESAQSHPRSGYFRLTLSAITVDGRQLALQTSSLFARATSQQSNASFPGRASELPSDGVRVPKGRHLTFRLTAPVTLNVPNSMANRQSLYPTIE